MHPAMHARSSSNLRNVFSFERAAEMKSVWAFCSLDQGLPDFLDQESSQPADFSWIIMGFGRCGGASGCTTIVGSIPCVWRPTVGGLQKGPQEGVLQELLQTISYSPFDNPVCTVQGGNPKPHIISYPAPEEGWYLFSVFSFSLWYSFRLPWVLCSTPVPQTL